MNGNASMRSETLGTEQMLVGKGRPLPRLAAAAPLDGRRAQIQWRDGRQVQVDLAPAFTTLRVFRGVRDDDALFRTMKVDEYGDAVIWEDGAELSAVWIEELADATLDNAEFRAAMDTLHLTLDGMAARLGIARRLVADYRKDKPIPKHIALATRYLLSRLAA